MGKITIILNDNAKRGELLELVANLPYVEAVQVEDTDHAPEEGASVSEHPINGSKNRAVSTVNYDTFTDDDPMDSEVASFEKQHAKLVEKYLGQFIALHQGQVIGHQFELEPLIRTVRKTHSGKIVLYRKVEETLPPVLYIRSPRLMRD